MSNNNINSNQNSTQILETNQNQKLSQQEIQNTTIPVQSNHQLPQNTNTDEENNPNKKIENNDYEEDLQFDEEIEVEPENKKSTQNLQTETKTNQNQQKQQQSDNEYEEDLEFDNYEKSQQNLQPQKEDESLKNNNESQQELDNITYKQQNNKNGNNNNNNDNEYGDEEFENEKNPNSQKNIQQNINSSQKLKERINQSISEKKYIPPQALNTNQFNQLVIEQKNQNPILDKKKQYQQRKEKEKAFVSNLKKPQFLKSQNKQISEKLLNIHAKNFKTNQQQNTDKTLSNPGNINDTSFFNFYDNSATNAGQLSEKRGNYQTVKPVSFKEYDYLSRNAHLNHQLQLIEQGQSKKHVKEEFYNPTYDQKLKKSKNSASNPVIGKQAFQISQQYGQQSPQPIRYLKKGQQIYFDNQAIAKKLNEIQKRKPKQNKDFFNQRYLEKEQKVKKLHIKHSSLGGGEQILPYQQNISAILPRINQSMTSKHQLTSDSQIQYTDGNQHQLQNELYNIKQKYQEERNHILQKYQVKQSQEFDIVKEFTKKDPLIEQKDSQQFYVSSGPSKTEITSPTQRQQKKKYSQLINQQLNSQNSPLQKKFYDSPTRNRQKKLQTLINPIVIQELENQKQELVQDIKTFQQLEKTGIRGKDLSEVREFKNKKLQQMMSNDQKLLEYKQMSPKKKQVKGQNNNVLSPKFLDGINDSESQLNSSKKRTSHSLYNQQQQPQQQIEYSNKENNNNTDTVQQDI